VSLVSVDSTPQKPHNDLLCALHKCIVFEIFSVKVAVNSDRKTVRGIK